MVASMRACACSSEAERLSPQFVLLSPSVRKPEPRSGILAKLGEGTILPLTPSHRGRAGERVSMAQAQSWARRCFKAFCKGFFVAVPVAVTFLDRVACVARVEGSSMQPSLNPGGSQSSDVVLLNHWKVRNFEVQRGDIVSLVGAYFVIMQGQ
ncbi:mitochondrial inner membrane protease subunit 2 isoform X4 [Mus caroli]|uniref:Mitochondrial inner membrane protease subunit 2 isoform X4 n=1 Tax=Mus caroli TaxID=10089 RepID=A0A6P7RRE1_MUSCR|nr:mitochondrial inner membrane protease subunit 2 isoform X4 [Mus caroli]